MWVEISSNGCFLQNVFYLLAGIIHYAGLSHMGTPLTWWSGWLRKTLLFVNCLWNVMTHWCSCLIKNQGYPPVARKCTFFLGYIFPWAYCFCCCCFPLSSPPLWGVLVGLSRALKWWKKRLSVVFWKNQLTGVVPFSIFLILEKCNNIKLLVTFHCFNNCVIHTIHCITLC